MKIIVGLGNPGARYAGTRHNAGRMLIEYMTVKRGISCSYKKSLKCFLAHAIWENTPVILAYPDVFMNLSGEALAPLSNYYQIDSARDLLVIVDDLSLPFGQWRLRSAGSAGGHNGLKSIALSLGSSAFARLRLGVGHPKDLEEGREVSDYVLSLFFPEERRKLPECFGEGEKACLLWAADSPEKAMNAVNVRKTKS